MKVAIVHDWLNTKIGGAESVFFELAKLYPQADLFALVCDYPKFSKYLSGRPVRTSKLQNYPSIFKRHPELFLPFIKKAVNGFDFENYDLVISSSTAWVKNIKINKNTKHLCYCHSPARMLWDSWPTYLNNKKIGPVKLGGISKYIISIFVSRLRIWDYYASSNVSQFVANSQFVAMRIKKFYGRDSVVIYPPVQTELFDSQYKILKQDYYLILSVLSTYKNIDLAIEAFKSSKKNLKIAGDGPDQLRLQNLASGAKNITFLGRIAENKKVKLLQEAKGFIFPGVEDFGITPVEAMAAGTPVIAYDKGGVTESVLNGKTGQLFSMSTIESLNQAIQKAENTDYDKNKLLAQAKKFDRQIFAREIKDQANKLFRQS